MATDAFRNAFFQKLIEEERAKDAALKLQQANCFHKYDTANGVNEIACSKCGHVRVMRHIPSKKGRSDCIVS